MCDVVLLSPPGISLHRAGLQRCAVRADVERRLAGGWRTGEVETNIVFFVLCHLVCFPFPLSLSLSFIVSLFYFLFLFKVILITLLFFSSLCVTLFASLFFLSSTVSLFSVSVSLYLLVSLTFLLFFIKVLIHSKTLVEVTQCLTFPFHSLTFPDNHSRISLLNTQTTIHTHTLCSHRDCHKY